MARLRNGQRPSIQDVARAAGVSPTTVSHALADKGRVSPETRLRIQRVAEELGYRASAMAHNLATGPRGLLGLHIAGGPGSMLMSAIDYFSELVDGATLEAMEHGYWLTIAPPSAGEDYWRTTHLDGAIVVDPAAGDTALDELRARGVPLVTTARSIDDAPGTYWVDNDQYTGTLRVLDHLEAAGARRIALLTTLPLRSYVVDCKRAYDDWVTGRGAAAVEIVDVSVSQIQRLLARADRPDALYATLDRIALAALLAADASGLRVPDDLLVATLVDSAAARSASPPLTALAQAPGVLGRRAVAMLAGIIAGEPIAEPHLLLEPSLVSRGSTAPRGSLAAAASSATRF